MEITSEQKRIAATEANNIVKEYQDNLDIEELEKAIYEAIIEALKSNSH